MAYTYITPYRRTGARRGQGSMNLFDLNRSINTLFDQMMGDDESHSAMQGGNRGMAMDVHTDQDRYEITVELPGVKQDDVDLRVDDKVLVISGEKRQTRESNDDSWTERSYGAFERRVSLPKDVDEDSIDASFEDGVLHITLPRSEEKSKGRRIELKSGSGKDGSRLIDQEDGDAKVGENA